MASMYCHGLSKLQCILICRMTGMPPHVLAIARREVQGMEERENSLTGSLLCIQAEMMVRFSAPQHLTYLPAAF